MDRSNQESKRELLDPTSEHSTAIWDQQGRPVEGIIVSKSGHATAYVERFVHVILRKLGPYLPYVLVKNTQFGVYPFRCKVYVHCIHCVYGHSGVDSKDKFYILHIVLIVKISFILFARCVYAYCLHFTYI